MSKFNSGKASLVAIFLSLLLGAFFLGKTLTSASAATVVDHCDYNCPSVSFNWDTQEIDVAEHYIYTDKVSVLDEAGHYICTDGGYSYPGSGTVCTKKDKPDKPATWVPDTYKFECPSGYSSNPGHDNCRQRVEATYKTIHHLVSVQYEKSSDPHKCHRPSDSTLENTYGMDHDAIHAFKDAHSEYLDSTPVAPEGYYLDHGVCYPNPTPIACVGDWNYTRVCSKQCDGGVLQQVFNITTQSSGGGAACTNNEGDTRWSDESCNTQSCDNEIQCPANSTPNSDKQCVCNGGYHQVEGDGLVCEADPAPTPNPDLCANIDGIQYSVPDGLHLDAGNINCVSFDQAGPPQRNDENGGTPTVLGASTVKGGQVLGASTMAKTGGFEENLYIAIMTLGGTITTFGLKSFKKVLKKA